jgi:nucleoside-diphosphate-sugar epimerase
MAVVVTGAAGFLGRALVAALAADGVPVIAIDRRPPAAGTRAAAGAPAGWSADLPPAAHRGPVPAASIPAASIPAVGVPAVGIPALVPAASIPAIGVAAALVPAALVPAVGVATSAPAASIPAASIPAVGVPAARLPAVGVPTVGVPAATALVTALQADLLAGDEAVRAALRRADVVFHLAGRPGVRETGPAAEAARLRDNVAATAAVLAAVPRGTPLVVTSSSSVYGGAAGRPSREGDPLRPRGGYARSKAAVEALCAARGGAVSVLRPFTVAGEGQRPDMALARWIAAARPGRPLRVLGSPARSRDVTDVRDAVRALRLAAEREVRGVLNVGTGRPHTLAELVAAVGRALGVPAEPEVWPAAAVEPAATWADTTLLQRRLGFLPVTDLDRLVARQAAATPAAATPVVEPWPVGRPDPTPALAAR